MLGMSGVPERRITCSGCGMGGSEITEKVHVAREEGREKETEVEVEVECSLLIGKSRSEADLL